MLCNSGISFQWMVAGVHGVTGAHALKRVALDHSTANDPVLGPLRHMEENHARDKRNRQELVTRSFAPVCVMACNLRNTLTNTGVKSHCQLSFGTLKKIFEIFFWLNEVETRSPHSARVTGNFHFLQFHFPSTSSSGLFPFSKGKSWGQGWLSPEFPPSFYSLNIKSVICFLLLFLVHGGWSSWTQWGACSKTCGNGKQYSRRYCNNPVPKYGGKKCYGAAVKTRECKVKPCPGNWVNSQKH